MRANRGFTLIEMVVVVAVIAIAAGVVMFYGKSARRNASLASGAYDMALRIARVKALAMADGHDHVFVVVDTADPAGCVNDDTRCGRSLVLKNPQAGFTIAGFNPDPPIVGAELVESEYLPRNSKFELASTWRPPVPFNAVQAWDTAIRATCAGGRACFALRFRATGDVDPLLVGAAGAGTGTGFAFVLGPQEVASRAAEQRGIFVSFPAGIVKTAAGTL